ncbi:MAG: hypothetical protein ACRECX_11800 [Methyloceanibacter sp.]|uniref:hypothetical protein n=1 Tax=Methyloceanibacter sp. TaxID=1965321 RepID=UPI003D6C87CF
MREVFEDTANDCGFGFVDTASAAQGFAGSGHLAHHVITEAETASRLALTNPAL